MAMTCRRLSLIVLVGSILLGCAASISTQARSQVTYFGPFAELQRQPALYTGDVALLGGKIIENRASDTGSELVVLQLMLDGSHRPKNDDRSEGRFIVKTDQFLDPVVFARGALITVVGKVQGAEIRTIDRMAYTYPLIQSLEIKKWPPSSQGPRFHFGIGVGKTF